MEAFTFLLSENEIDGATRQLQQAFAMGEYMPSVLSVPRESKRKVLSYTRNAFQLVNAIEAKNYTLATDLIEEMRNQARDFDYSKPSAAVEGAKLASNMKLRTAKNAALRGDDAAFDRNLTEATMLWPTNPAIKKGIHDDCRLRRCPTTGAIGIRPAFKHPELSTNFLRTKPAFWPRQPTIGNARKHST